MGQENEALIDQCAEFVSKTDEHEQIVLRTESTDVEKGNSRELKLMEDALQSLNAENSVLRKDLDAAQTRVSSLLQEQAALEKKYHEAVEKSSGAADKLFKLKEKEAMVERE